ncbi:hypothetical protein evm_015005 [Chilo suppressalis]|nr:hypothetical protein evm_015005 [Chilo suppressalis]
MKTLTNSPGRPVSVVVMPHRLVRTRSKALESVLIFLNSDTMLFASVFFVSVTLYLTYVESSQYRSDYEYEREARRLA